MSHVRKTEEIWKQIRTKIAQMFAERRTHAHDWYSYGINKDEFDQRCWRSLVSVDEEKLMESLGQRFFTSSDDLEVLIPASDTDTVSYSIKFQPERMIPSCWSGYYSGKQTVTDPDIVAISKQRHLKIRTVTDAEDAFRSMVKGVWENAPSVNRFVKLWPPGRDLLDRSVIDMLDEKPKREEKPTALTEEQTAALNTKLLQARVAA